MSVSLFSAISKLRIDLVLQALNSGEEHVDRFKVRRELPICHAIDSSFLAGGGSLATEIIELLIMRGADVNTPDYTGITPLYKANENSTVRLLLRHKADVNARSDSGTVLHNAVALMNIDKIKLLLEHNVDLNLRNDEGQTALELARRFGMKEIVTLLETHMAKSHSLEAESFKAKIDSEETEMDSEKAEIERLSALELDLLDETEVEITDESEEWIKASKEWLKELKKAEKDKKLSKIIIHDIREGLFLEKLKRADYVKLLASVEGRTDRHKLLLNIAKKYQRDRKEAEEIIHKIEAVGLSNYFGFDYLNEEQLSKTALHMAVVERCEKPVLDFLLKYISVNCIDNTDHTPLDIAIIKGNKAAFNILIQSGAYIGKKDKEPHEKHLEKLNPPLLTIIQRASPSKISKKHQKLCLKMADRLIEMGASVCLNVDLLWEPTPVYIKALGIICKSVCNGEQSFYNYVYWPVNRELVLRVLSEQTVDLAEKVMRSHSDELPNLTLVDYCTNAVSKNHEFLGYDQYGFHRDVEHYLPYIEKILEVLKAALISRLAKRMVAMEKIFDETQISETGQGIHNFPRALSNIMIQYASDGNGSEEAEYATTEPGRALLFSLIADPLLRKEINELKNLHNKSKIS